MTDCEIIGNSARDGAGVHIMGSEKTTTLVNCLISDNTANGRGGVYVYYQTPSFTNCAIAGNSAAIGGGLYVVDGAATLYNSIVALNTAKVSGADVCVDGSKATVDARNTLSSFADWTNASADGVVNYVYDAELPLFNDAANGDYSLAENSQALDKGNDAYAVDANGNALTTDLAGASRFGGKAVDIGPYEFSPFAPAAPTNVKFGAYDAASKTATLTWTDNATNETRYEARYSVDDGATWTTLANLAANSTSRVCDDLNVGETYVFQIRAVAANGLTSDWASAKFLVLATFGASEYVVEQNCAFYLSATGANDDSLSYYWDLSGSEVEESSSFIERESGFWTSVEELGFGVGEQTIRMRSRDASGTFGPTVTATLRVVASQPTFNVTTSSNADGSILRLNLRATTPDDSPIARWRLDWGDGQTSEFAELSDALTTGHYYAPTAEDAVYEVSLTTFDATGAGGDFVYALTSHSVPGRVAASQASVETGSSATILEEALTADAASVCVAEEVEFVASFESASRCGRSTARSDAVSEAFAEFFAEDDGEDDFWFEFEKAAGKRR